MQYNGLGGGQFAVGNPRAQQNHGSLVRAATYGDATPMNTFTDLRRPSWRSVSAQQSGHHGVFINSDDGPKTVVPVPFHKNDVVARHLLVETALLDSVDFELLPIEEVDALKKEKVQLEARLDATRRKLALESKVKDAAQSLHRLYLGGSDNGRRPSTPLSPDKKRMSFLGERGRSTSGKGTPHTINQAGNELEASTKKVDELLQILAGLESRRQYVESRLLRHTAAVLQAAHTDETTSEPNGLNIDLPNGFEDSTLVNGSLSHSLSRSPGYQDSIYSDSRDSMRDLMPAGLNGLIHGLQPRKPSILGPSRRSAEDDEKIALVQGRLEVLNSQMRTLIKQARSGRDDDKEAFEDLASVYPEDDDPFGRITGQVELIDKSIKLFEQEFQDLKNEHERMINDTKHQQHAVEGQLESINNQLYILLTEANAASTGFDLAPPPAISGHSAQEQINHLEESLLAIESILQQSAESNHGVHEDLARDLEASNSKASEHAAKSSQIETVLTGLWQIIGSHEDDDQGGSSEPFSLQGFSTRVQHIFDRTSQHDVQVGILRRQIEQQRELNSKSDGEKERQLTDLQASYAQLEEQLVDISAKQATAEAQAEEARTEMDNVMNELENIKQTASTHTEQRQQVLNELEEHKARNRELESAVADHEAHVADLQDDARLAAVETDARIQELASVHTAREGAEARYNEKHGEMQQLEAEVVRLTTELTMVKADLDGAYGSRAERANQVAMNPAIQAQLGKMDELNQHNASMAAELAELRQQKDVHAREIENLTSKHNSAAERSISLEQEMAALQTQQSGGVRDDTRTAILEKELREMAKEYQEVTRESVEVEKEREQLESLVDGLREKCDALESQLSDEKVRWLGVRSPTQSTHGEQAREMTSTMVLRNEFKKMMRETRAEGVRQLKVSFVLYSFIYSTNSNVYMQAEQEERRRLEAVVRGLRRDNMPVKSALAPR